MTQISKHFTRAENACRCGDCNKFGADIKLVQAMELLREHFDSPVIVHSWFRCREHNNRSITKKSASGVYGAGSNDKSWHLTGSAIDFHVQGVDNAMVHHYLRSKYKGRHGVGIYDWGIHLDVRPLRADWDERQESDLYPA